MKKSLPFFISLFCTILLSFQGSNAQSPEKISYQAVIRDSENKLVTYTEVGMQISILQGAADGSVVFTETHTPTTNGNGLISIEIGAGSGSDDLSLINWEQGPFFVKTETDPTGGTNYTLTGVSQLLSVPYALHAKTATTITDEIPASQVRDLEYFTNDDETDPVFSSSFVAGISQKDTTRWGNKSDFDGDYASLSNAPQLASTVDEKTIQLNANDASSSLNITKNNGTSVLKVDGSGAITGDGSGLSFVRSVIGYTGGNFEKEVTSTDPYEPTLIKTVEITVEGKGVVLVQATGYTQWGSTGTDYFRMSAIQSNVPTGSATFGNNYFNYLIIGTDFGCTDDTDQYSPFAYSRVFTVESEGTYTYNLWADKVFDTSIINFGDINMQAIYIPTGGNGNTAPNSVVKLEPETEIQRTFNPGTISGN